MNAGDQIAIKQALLESVKLNSKEVQKIIRRYSPASDAMRKFAAENNDLAEYKKPPMKSSGMARRSYIVLKIEIGGFYLAEESQTVWAAAKLPFGETEKCQILHHHKSGSLSAIIKGVPVELTDDQRREYRKFEKEIMKAKKHAAEQKI